MSWTIDSTGLMFIALVCLGVGLLFGMLISMFRSGRSRGKPPKKNLSEAATIWQDEKDDQFWVEIGKQTVSNFDELSDENRSKLTLITRYFSPSAAEEILSTQVEPQSVEVQAVSIPDRDSVSNGSTTSQLQNEKAWEATIGLAAVENAQNEKPRIDIVKGLRLTLEGDSSRTQSTQSIAAQVDEILQEKIKGTELERKGLRLMELPGQGMVVLVGMEKFESVDEVPYPEIKAVLKDSVSVWEDKMLH